MGNAWRDVLSDTDRERGTIEGRDFAGCSLAGAEIEGLHFAGCDFSGVDLAEARLDDAVLESCKLVDAVLRGAVMNGARLSGCDLTRLDASQAEMTGVKIRSCLARDIVLTGANLAKCEIDATDLRGAVLTGASLRAAAIRRSDLRGARMQGTDLRRKARLSDCDLRDADLAGARLGNTWLRACVVEDLVGVPKEPWDLHAVHLTGPTSGHEGDEESLFTPWRQARPFDARRPPGELGASHEDDGTLLMNVLEVRPELETSFGVDVPVFPVRLPWFQRLAIFAMHASEAAPSRLIYVAQAPDGGVLLLDGLQRNLSRAASLEGVRLLEASSALEYARFGYHATRGSEQGASWITSVDQVPWKHPGDESVTRFCATHGHLIGPERVEPSGEGWTIEAWAAWPGALVRNTITVGHDGAYAIDETIVEQDLPALEEADDGDRLA